MAHSPDRRAPPALRSSVTTSAASSSARAASTWPRSRARRVADTIYAIDRVADDTLLDWFEAALAGRARWCPKGLDEPVVVGDDPAWTVIVDTIDGTRGLMYDKRPAWCLAAAAPRGGSLRDIVAAAMTELPTAKQGAADQLSGTRGGGVVAERVDLRDGRRDALARAAVVGHRSRARLRRSGQVLRAGEASRWPSSSPRCSRGSGAATCSTTSTSRPAASSTS